MNNWAKKVYKLFLTCVLFVLPLWVSAQDNYKPLSSNSPFFTDTNMKIGDFVQQLFTWSIGIASVLTVFMLILGGFKYLTSAASSADETKKAKEQIRNALLGLFLLIISVFILQTINPSLTRLDAVLPEVSIEADLINSVGTFCVTSNTGGSLVTSGREETLECFRSEGACEAAITSAGYERNGRSCSGGNGNGRSVCTGTNYSCQESDKSVEYRNCEECTEIDSSLDVKQNACGSEAASCKISSKLNACLTGLAGTNGIAGWRVTEAWPPTVNHQNPCHQNGTCIDANFTISNPTAEQIADYIEAAHNNGLRAVYEVKGNSQAEKDLIRDVKNELSVARNFNGNIDGAIIKVGAITAAHFSVYPEASQCR